MMTMYYSHNIILGLGAQCIATICGSKIVIDGQGTTCDRLGTINVAIIQAQTTTYLTIEDDIYNYTHNFEIDCECGYYSRYGI